METNEEDMNHFKLCTEIMESIHNHENPRLIGMPDLNAMETFDEPKGIRLIEAHSGIFILPNQSPPPSAKIVFDKPKKCEFCDMEFGSNIELSQHILFEHLNAAQIEVKDSDKEDDDDEESDEEETDFENLEESPKEQSKCITQIIHKWKGGAIYCCNLCNKNFSKNINLKRHMYSGNLHRKNYLAKYGVEPPMFRKNKKKKKKMDKLKKEEKHWRCISCNKFFSLKSYLVVHLKTTVIHKELGKDDPAKNKEHWYIGDDDKENERLFKQKTFERPKIYCR